ncbi:sulfurtransferase [Actinotalea sp. K2]|uniref:sulfurtransferase n=1 Tax=Actinotalea sp. K2 TaxID=2939438 RepID=UPI002016F34B|nr:sulfurtransferase [Actinotalea sp. K2]MCL3859663.1 sulfurtransferase [Actinotalea sp. K2]
MTDRALISPDELAASLTDPTPPLLVDVRWSLAGSDRPGYLAGHLPGAVFCDLDTELAAPPGEGGRHPLPTQDSLTATMRRRGIGPGREVVVYDAGPGAAAARAWWCLRWAGHEQVRVLDGGLAAWQRSGGALEVGEVAPQPAPQARAHVGSMPVVEVDDVLAGRGGTLLDARSAERFRGEVEPVDPVAGHIPGAQSCPTTALQEADGRYLAPSALREVLAPLVGGRQGPVTAYCGSGVTAAQLVLAGHEAGVDVGLYPGSWSHWVRDAARPVATGPAAGRL